MSELPILDPQPLRDLLDLGAEEGLIQELIGMFQEDIPPRLEALRAGLASGDMTKIMMESHQMKGALSNLGLVRFAEMAALIETEARAGILDRTQATTESLPAAYDEALAALQQAFPSA